MHYINNIKSIDKLTILYNTSDLLFTSLIDLNNRLTYLGNYYIKTNNSLSLQYRELNTLVVKKIYKRMKV